MNRLVFLVVLALAGIHLVNSLPDNYNGRGSDQGGGSVGDIDLRGLFGSIANIIDESIKLGQRMGKQQQTKNGGQSSSGGYGQGGGFEGDQVKGGAFSGLFGSIADVVNESVKLGQRRKTQQQYENGKGTNHIFKDSIMEDKMGVKVDTPSRT